MELDRKVKGIIAGLALGLAVVGGHDGYMLNQWRKPAERLQEIDKEVKAQKGILNKAKVGCGYKEEIEGLVKNSNKYWNKMWVGDLILKNPVQTEYKKMKSELDQCDTYRAGRDLYNGGKKFFEDLGNLFKTK